MSPSAESRALMNECMGVGEICSRDGGVGACQ